MANVARVENLPPLPCRTRGLLAHIKAIYARLKTKSRHLGLGEYPQPGREKEKKTRVGGMVLCDPQILGVPDDSTLYAILRADETF